MLLILAAWAVLGEAQYRPSYQPTGTAYGIINDTFGITFLYSQWQGYFLNQFLLPAGLLPPCSKVLFACCARVVCNAAPLLVQARAS